MNRTVSLSNDSTRPEIIVQGSLLHAFAFDFLLLVFGPSAFMRALQTSNRLCHSHRRRLLAVDECHDSIDPCCALSFSPLQLEVDTNKAFFFFRRHEHTRQTNGKINKQTNTRNIQYIYSGILAVLGIIYTIILCYFLFGVNGVGWPHGCFRSCSCSYYSISIRHSIYVPVTLVADNE